MVARIVRVQRGQTVPMSYNRCNSRRARRSTVASVRQERKITTAYVYVGSFYDLCTMAT